jgi:hypothetical protein
MPDEDFGREVRMQTVLDSWRLAGCPNVEAVRLLNVDELLAVLSDTSPDDAVILLEMAAGRVRVDER